MPTKKRWMKIPPKPARSKIPDDLKLEVQHKADQFIESYLRPTFILPPPTDTRWNYIAEIFTKWHQRYFYFCAKYRCPAPNCISEFFEMKFTRLEFVGNNNFNVAYMRHTEQWFEILEDLSLEECFQEMKDIELLHPWFRMEFMIWILDHKRDANWLPNFSQLVKRLFSNY